MGKKNLEQLFKETFTGFHEVPDERVWESIEASLDKKDKKRVIPIWWRMGGVAALLAILFYVINPFDNTGNDSQILITDTENKEEVHQNDSILKHPNAQELTNSSKEDVTGDTKDASTKDYEDTTDGSINKDQSIKNAQEYATTDVSEKESRLENRNDPKNNLSQGAGFEKTKQEAQSIASVDSIATKKKSATKNDAADVLGFPNKKQKDAIAVVEEKDKKMVPPSNKNMEALKKEETLHQEQEEEGIAQNKKQSIFDAIEQQEEEAIVKNTSSKWSVGPSVAPVYFGSTGEGSPIHSEFASNSKSGNVNLSYGVTVAYDVGKRLKVRSGVHKVNFGYDTDGISASSSLDGSTNDQINNISYNQTSRNLVLQSKASIPETFGDVPFLELAANETPGVDGNLVQQLGYIEVPLELSYALVDKKFGLDLIGGVSSLFLIEGDNSILVEAEGLVTEVGTANNANSLNFSTNIGLGLNYEFSPKVLLNIEPVFKYQLNTFSETAGTFNPFSIGVYSGISFRF